MENPKLTGLNIRSLFRPGNLYSIYKLLRNIGPDIVLLNETWHDSNSNRTLLDGRYSLLLSVGEGRGGGVGIIYKKKLLLMPLFAEFHTRNFLLVRLSSTSVTRPVILFSAYFPPDERRWEVVSLLTRVVDFLRSRYSEFNLIGYCDLNADVTQGQLSSTHKKMGLALAQIGLSVHASSSGFTRVQGTHRSYLDYFLTLNASVSDIQVGDRVGSSDHLPITTTIKDCAPILRARGLVFSKRLAREVLCQNLETVRLGGYPLGAFRRLSGLAKRECLIYEPAPRSHFKTVAAVESELNAHHPDWSKISRIILRCKRLEFLILLGDLNRLRRENLSSEFHKVVQRILRLRESSSCASVNEIVDPEDPSQILHEPDRLRDTLSAKYRALFNSDSFVTPFAVAVQQPVSGEEVQIAARSIKINKGLALDCISDSILSRSLPSFVARRLADLINSILARGSIPTPFCLSRLHLLNKLKSGLPGLGDLRPIMISSPIMKLIESIALNELKEKLEGRITKSQVGFLPKLGTQVHLVRMLGRIRDIQSSPDFKPLRWHVLFIDFKSAFDKVNHSILFTKLQAENISSRTLDILRVLYNSYHFTLPRDQPHKINSGVAQGSLVSPLLFDLYVNDLIEGLSTEFGQQNVFAYADDVAVLCLGYSDVRSALSLVERWSSANSMELNKKKCGILSVCKKSTPLRRKEIAGVPFVAEYKYLGVPLDQALTLKHLLAHVKKKTKRFSLRIRTILHTVVGAKAKLNLWQTYHRCHFDYFAPSIALCGRTAEFSSCYTSSLKNALGLPLQTPNAPLLRLLRQPSPLQIAGHHVHRNLDLIRTRFGTAPQCVLAAEGAVNQLHREYTALRHRNSAVVQTDAAIYVVDLLHDGSCLGKNLLGLGCGTLLSLRVKKRESGVIGSLRSCPLCHLPATQQHFVNRCPVNDGPRRDLQASVPRDFIVHLLQSNEFNSFFSDIGELRVSVQPPPEGTNAEEHFSPLLLSLGRAASTAANIMVANTLKLFEPPL